MMRMIIPFILLGLGIPYLAVAQPRLKVVGGLRIDMGRIDRGEVVARQVTLRNDGNQKLTIHNVEASCGCTGASVLNKNLDPGETTLLFITFDSKPYRGPFHSSVTIVTNAAEGPSTVIDFLATVKEDLSFSPPWFHFTNADAAGRYTAVVKVKNESAKDITITGSSTRIPNVTLKYSRKAIPPNHSIDVTAQLVPRDSTPIVGDSIRFATTSSMQPDLYIRVYRTFKRGR